MIELELSRRGKIILESWKWFKTRFHPLFLCLYDTVCYVHRAVIIWKRRPWSNHEQSACCICPAILTSAACQFSNTFNLYCRNRMDDLFIDLSNFVLIFECSKKYATSSGIPAYRMGKYFMMETLLSVEREECRMLSPVPLNLSFLSTF
jgi:hypothetical protein